MNLIIRDFPDDLADWLKKTTGSATLSKAVLTATNDHHWIMIQNQDLSSEVLRLRNEIDRLQALIESARTAAYQLVERTSQTELRV